MFLIQIKDLLVRNKNHDYTPRSYAHSITRESAEKRNLDRLPA